MKTQNETKTIAMSQETVLLTRRVTFSPSFQPLSFHGYVYKMELTVPLQE